MLSEKMYNQLNQQINLEFFSSNLYLQMSAWCAHKSLDGASAFLRQHANEEMMHMTRLFNYVTETGELPILGAIDAPDSSYENIRDVFQKTYEHETVITKAINELADTAFREKDYSTFNFLQWYVAEQHEEEKLFKSIVDKIDMIGMDHKGLFFIDKEIAEIDAANRAAAASEPTA